MFILGNVKNKIFFFNLFLLLLSFFIVFFISGFKPGSFIGWYDEIDSILSWAASHNYSELFNESFAGGTFLDEGFHRSSPLTYFIVKQNDSLRAIGFFLLRSIWIYILLLQVFFSCKKKEYALKSIFVTTIFILCDFCIWGLFYGGLGYRFALVSLFLLINNSQLKFNNPLLLRNIFFILAIVGFAYFSLTSLEYEAIFVLELLIIYIFSKIKLKRLFLKIDINFCLILFISLITILYLFSTSTNSNIIFARDLIFNYRNHSVNKLFTISGVIWSNFFLRTLISILGISLIAKKEGLRDYFSIIFVALLPVFIGYLIYFIQNIFNFLNYQSQIMLYRSNFHASCDQLFLSIFYVGLITKRYDFIEEESKLNSNKILKIFFIFFSIPMTYSLVERSNIETSWTKRSDNFVRSLNSQGCKNLAISSYKDLRLYSFYKEGYSSFFGFKPYNSLRRHSFINRLLNEKIQFNYHHLEMLGETKDYDMDWFKLTNICGIVDDKLGFNKYNQDQEFYNKNFSIIASENLKDTISLMKNNKDKVINYEIVVQENYVKNNDKKNSEIIQNIKLLESINKPISNFVIFKREYSNRYIAICSDYKKKELGTIKSANLINTLVKCPQKPLKVELFYLR